MGTVVETGSGRIEGVEENGVQVFRGIPYARAPQGELRFGAPRDPEPWAGVRDCSGYGPSSLQIEPQVRILPGTDVGQMSEDCLFLNLWTPAADARRRPVLVWIHGGGFVGGAGSRPLYTDSPLVARGDAVLVTINYRLGVLGFTDFGALARERIGAVSNAGLRDQLAALGWVRENIAAFGGDPANVTIFGESAGGMSVGTLLGTPAARGLFAKSVAQSGAAHNVHTAESAARVARELLEALEIPAEAPERLLDVPAERLLELQGRLIERQRGGENLLPFQPVVDGELLPEAPLQALRSGLSAEVPTLVGTTRDEWKLFAMMDPRSGQLDEAGLRKRVEARVGEAASRIIEGYREIRSARGDSTEAHELFSAIETDRVFRIPAIRLAAAQAAQQQRCYAYLFDWTSPALGGRLGSCHALEVPFVFGTLGMPGLEAFVGAGPEANRLSEQMQESWLAFARSGEPGHSGVGDWGRYDEARRETMVLGPNCGSCTRPFDAERSLWTGVID